MVCQITAGSLPLSAMGALSRKVTSACRASLVFGPYHTVAAGRSTAAVPSAVRETVWLRYVLGIKSAHVVDASMGGMIAQEVALSFPQRVRSLTSIMSTTGNPRLPPPTREAAAMLMAPPPRTKEEYFERFARTWKVLRVGSFPEDEALDPARAARTYERGLNPAGVGRQLRAVLAS